MPPFWVAQSGSTQRRRKKAKQVKIGSNGSHVAIYITIQDYTTQLNRGRSHNLYSDLLHWPSFLSFLKIIYLFWEREGRRGRERERERTQGKLHAVSTEPDVGLELTKHEIVTWAEIKSQTRNRLSHPGVPWPLFLNTDKNLLCLNHLGSWWHTRISEARSTQFWFGRFVVSNFYVNSSLKTTAMEAVLSIIFVTSILACGPLGLSLNPQLLPSSIILIFLPLWEPLLCSISLLTLLLSYICCCVHIS